MNECAMNRLFLAEKFRECQNMILALGDETRQHIIIALLESEKAGLRVGEITKLTHLSRPAVSHHLKILKDAKIISMRRVGTMNFYYMNANDTEWGKLTELVNKVYDITKKAIHNGYPPCSNEHDDMEYN